MKKIEKFLIKTHIFYFIGIYVFFMFILSIPFAFMAEYTYTYFGEFFPDTNKSYSFTKYFIILVLIVPFIETYFFHGLIIYLLKRYITSDRLWIIVVSSMIFAISHWYSISYIIAVIPKSFLLSHARILLFERKSSLITIFYIHALVNLIPYFFI